MKIQIGKKNIIILIGIVVFIFIVIIIVNVIKPNNTENKDIEIEDDVNEEIEKIDIDNSEDTTVEEDPNSEDAIEVFNTIDKLIKGELHYPVRNDGKKVVYLTFDDGPSTTNTPMVLDILKQNNIKATFMIKGSSLEVSETSRDILKRTVKEGHAIGNHTYSHDYKYLYPADENNQMTISPDNFIADIDKCNKALKSVLGEDFETRVIRFPGGYWSWEGRTAIKPIIEERGYASINWNALCKDSEGKPNKTSDELIKISEECLDNLGDSADSVVFLMHDTYGKEETVKALQKIIDMFRERGFEFKTIK